MRALRFWIYRKTSGLGPLPPGVARNPFQAAIYAINEVMLDFAITISEILKPAIEKATESFVEFGRAFQESYEKAFNTENN